MTKNLGSRKNRGGKHPHHHHSDDQPPSTAPPVKEPQRQSGASEESDRARRARRHRHHHAHKEKHHHKNENVHFENDHAEAGTDRNGSPHEEVRIVEDSSMAVLANAMSSQNILSSAASSATDMTSKTRGSYPDKDDGLKEWVPQFVKSYGYCSLFRFASAVDYTLMAIGTIAALVAGCCIPAIVYLLGNLIRIKALADKMKCTMVSGSAGACESFLNTCDENTIDPSRYNDRRFLHRPLPIDNAKITTDHMEYFIELELTITFAYTLSSSIYFFCWNYASWNQGGKLRRAYFQSLLQKDLTWFDTQEDPDAINRLLESTRRIVEAIGESIPVAISLTVMCILFIGLAFYHGWQLTMVCLSTLPLLLGTIWMVNGMKATKILKERRAYRVAHDLSKEVFSKIRTVIGYSTQKTERALYRREISRGNRYVIGPIILQSLSVALMYIINFGLWAVVFWYGMELVLESAGDTCTDQTTPGVYDAADIFVVILSVIFGCGNLYIVMNAAQAAHVAQLCCREVLKIIDSPNGVDNMSSDGVYLEGPLIGRVEFVDVRFTYPGNKRRLALNQLSFVAEPNTTVAIVGLSDSGKSTALKLICKEYLPDSGFVQIDGHDIRTLNTKWLRAHIGYIPQEQTLFDMSIEDNVRMGKLDANFFQIQEACIKAGAHDFIISFKEGYQTKIGHRGNRLTPSQKQHLAIARALIREPKILLLDEPTYALDSQSVIDFMRSLQNISKERTVILVAHRLATVVHANMIYVLKNGKVLEKGDHHKLIKNKGAYSQLCVVNRPSTSYHPGAVRIEGFDTSEMSIVSCVKTFNQKPILPSLYNNMLSVDPVVSRVTYAILKSDKDTERGFHAKLEWTLENAQELPSTSPHDDDTFGKGLREVSSSNNIDMVDTQQPASKDPISEEYRSISIMTQSRRIWIRVLTMGSSNHWLIFLGILSTILLSIGIPFFGVLVALTIDILSDVQAYPRNWKWAETFNKSVGFPTLITISIAGLGLCCGVFAFLQDLCLNLAAYMSVQKMRRVLYGCILNQDMSFFEDPKNSPITLASILFQDTDSIRHVTFGVYATLLQCICMLIVSMTICILHAVELTGYTLLYVALVVGVNLADGWLAKRQHGKTIHALQLMSKLLLQVFQSKHVITVCQMEPHFVKEFTTLQRKSLGTNKSLSCVRIFTYGLAQSAVFWGFGLFLYLGVERIKTGNENFLDIMINGFVIIFALLTLGTNLSIVMGFKHINKGGKRMLEIINRKPLISADDGLNITEDDCTKEIEFVNAHFWRPQTPDSTLLKGLNLMIPPRQVTAIVGYPESGKSAYMELLARYYDATGGLLTIAGKDIRYYSTDSLREQLSVVAKEPELFSRTVAQNIALGATFRRPSMDEVIQAAKEANVHNLIVSLPEGYETRIHGERDYLSSAQKQKISIARALLKNPKILIFDEVTSLLDKDGEQAVLESIAMVKQNRTVIMISHRIQPVQNADWIVVMEKGYLEEQGKHDDLLKRRASGIYASMWRSQNPLQDENFLKGTISYSGRKSHARDERRSKLQAVPLPQSPSKALQAPPNPKPVDAAPPPKEEEPQDEPPEATPMCGGIFSFLGLGMMEPREDYDDVDYEEKGGGHHQK